MKHYNVVDMLRRRFRIKNVYIKEFLAEFLGTFILIIFGNGSVAQMVLGNNANDYFSVIWGYSLGVVFGVIVSGGISGGHINPAVTLAMALWGKLPWNKVPFYMVAQYLGAFVASVVLFYEYYDALIAFEPSRSLATAGIFATYPGVIADVNGETKQFLTSMSGFGDQILGTALLLIAVCGITDKKNLDIPGWLSPLFVGFAVMNIGLSFGFSSGFAINPARDLAPRIFTLLAGWNDVPFSASTIDAVTWWWVPVIATHLGGIIGVLVYTLFIEMHHEEEGEFDLKKIEENSPEFAPSANGVFMVSSTTLDSTKLKQENGKMSFVDP